MAAVTTQKCSERRTLLNRAAEMIQGLIAINEAADRQRRTMIANGDDPEDTVNAILAGAGPSTDTTADTSDTVVGDLINMLNANANNAVGWEYLAE